MKITLKFNSKKELENYLFEKNKLSLNVCINCIYLGTNENKCNICRLGSNFVNKMDNQNQ